MRQRSECGRGSGVKAAIILALALLAGQLLAADPQVAEIEQQLAHAAPAERSALLSKLSAVVEFENTNLAWDHAQAARKEAKSPTDEVRADARIAALQRRRGNYAYALATIQAALPRAVSLGDAVLHAELLLVLANTQESLGDFPTALETFSELLPLAEAREDSLFVARVYNTLGITYSDAGQPDLARQAFATARTHADKSGDRRMAGSILNNLGNLDMDAGRLEQSRAHHEQALAIRESTGSDSRGVADSNQNLAELSVLEGHPEKALPYFDRASALYQSMGLKRNLTNAHIGYASALRALGRMDEALEHLNAAQALADALKTPVTLSRVYREFANYYEARGDYRRALEYSRKLATATDAAVGERSRQRFDALQARFQAERRQHEIDVLRRDQAEHAVKLARARDQRYGLLALLAVVALALGAFVSRHRLKRRTEQRILLEATAARQSAEQADALKTRLVSVVSHDIRAPLGNILAMGEELRDESAKMARDPRVQVIVHESQHVLGLAQDLLDVAAIETGRLELQTAPLDLTQVVRTTVERLRLSAETKGQKIEFTAPSANESGVLGDPARLAQVTANLISNAIKYSPRGSTVKVALARAAEWVRLTVCDEGPGISAENLPHIFLPFTRAAAQPTGGELSHGLGLSIVYDLVRLHGGNIRVDSKPGQGATFIIDLPAST